MVVIDLLWSYRSSLLSCFFFFQNKSFVGVGRGLSYVVSNILFRNISSFLLNTSKGCVGSTWRREKYTALICSSNTILSFSLDFALLETGIAKIFWVLLILHWLIWNDLSEISRMKQNIFSISYTAELKLLADPGRMVKVVKVIIWSCNSGIWRTTNFLAYSNF